MASQPRNPFSFCPFSGGSRICLGKNLSEIMAVYVLPLLIYHYDFELTSPEHMKIKPNFSIGSPKEPVIPMKYTQIRFLKKD
jgi:cytochrome P450